MKLVDMTVTGYLETVMSDAPAPGGGSVAALSSTQACALVSMVADLTLGKEKYAEYFEVCEATKAKMQELYKELYAGVDNDTDAFMKVSAAYKMPKDTDELNQPERCIRLRSSCTQLPHRSKRSLAERQDKPSRRKG